MIRYAVRTESAVEADVEPHSTGMKARKHGLGLNFLQNFRAAYERIVDHPIGYQDLRSGIRRALTRRFPYAVYFSVEGETIVVVAVLSTARDPAEWQRRI